MDIKNELLKISFYADRKTAGAINNVVDNMTAEWVLIDKWRYRCSNCGKILNVSHTNMPYLSKTKFCSDCGREMK